MTADTATANIVDVAIVGAGLAGCTAAVLLARSGRTVALVEKRAFPRRKVCGECVAASNMPLLQQLGVLDAVMESAGAPLTRVVLQRGSASVSAELPASDEPCARYGIALGRDLFDRVMRDRARDAGADILQPWTVLRASDDADGGHHLSLRATDGRVTRTLRARVLIDAHGSWEPVSLDGRACAARPARDTDLLAFKANFGNSAQLAGEIGVLALNGGYGGMVQEGGGRATLACCIRRDRLATLRAADPGRPAGDVVEAWLRRECRGVEVALEPAWRDGRWLASGPLKPGIRAGGIVPGSSRTVLRIGNAAGEAHPILGEGMSMAMQSGAMLAERLIEAESLESRDMAVLNRRYGIAYRRRFATRICLAALFAHLAMRPRSSAAMQLLVNAMPGLLSAGARLGGKVDVPALPRERPTHSTKRKP